MRLTVDGADETEAFQTIGELLPPGLERNDMRTLSGIAASPGIAMGRLCVIDRRRSVVRSIRFFRKRFPMKQPV